MNVSSPKTTSQAWLKFQVAQKRKDWARKDSKTQINTPHAINSNGRCLPREGIGKCYLLYLVFRKQIVWELHIGAHQHKFKHSTYICDAHPSLSEPISSFRGESEPPPERNFQGYTGSCVIESLFESAHSCKWGLWGSRERPTNA